MSFQEKGLWVTLVSLLAVFGWYFASVLPARGAVIEPDQVVRFVLAVVALVVLQVVGQVLIALVERRPGTDERDRWIALIGTRNGSVVLAAGVCLALTAAVLSRGNFVFTHVLLGSWVLAQLVGVASQLVLYRQGG